MNPRSGTIAVLPPASGFSLFVNLVVVDALLVINAAQGDDDGDDNDEDDEVVRYDLEE
jgi:hypothetical protein